MKLFLLLLFHISFPKDSVMIEFHKLQSEKDELSFLKKYQNETTPEILGYVFAVEMKQAEYTANPFKKLKIFNTTKKKLNTLIENNPSCVDLRYLRLLLQERTPKILGYDDNIEADKIFLKNEIDGQKVSVELTKYILKNTSL